MKAQIKPRNGFSKTVMIKQIQCSARTWADFAIRGKYEYSIPLKTCVKGVSYKTFILTNN